MKKAVVTIPVPSGPNGTGSVAVDVSATALAPLSVGDPLTLNPVNSSVNITSFGLTQCFVSAADEITFIVKLQSAPIDVLISTP